MIKTMPKKRKGIKLYALFILGIVYCTSAQAQQQDTQDKLSNVESEIKSQQLTIEKTSKQQKALEEKIKKSDLQIANLARNLRNTANAIRKKQSNLSELKQKQSTLHAQKAQQEDALSALLRSAYSAGQYDYLKMLLNQQKSSEVQRSLIYYQYLNKARTSQIDKFKALIVEIKNVEQEQTLQLAQLNELQIQQKQNQAGLKIEKASQQENLVALNKILTTEKQKLDRLKVEEQNLKLTLERIQKEAQERARQQQISTSLSGLAKLKKKLNWPTKGKLSKRFGNRKQGSLKWKGVLMSAPVGRTVNTIYQGKVLFSDWLKGYGLVTVIDHGKGYMSLYGHNQTLLKQVGDIVETGEPIALVGQSGGQSTAGLYFEIRHNGKAVNPKIWCKS